MAKLIIANLERVENLTQEKYDKYRPANKKDWIALRETRERSEKATGTKFSVIRDESPQFHIISLRHGDFALDISATWTRKKRKYMVEIWKVGGNGYPVPSRIESHYPENVSEEQVFCLVNQLLENFEIYADYWATVK